MDRQKPSESSIKVMEYAFHLNRDWLLKGDGDCFLHGKAQKKAGDGVEKTLKDWPAQGPGATSEVREGFKYLDHEVPGVDDLDVDMFVEAVEERKDIPGLVKKLEYILRRGTERQRYFMRRAVEAVFEKVKKE